MSPSLSERRNKRMLSYAKKCVKHPLNSRFFPSNENMSVNPIIRNREPYTVNFARTEAYKKSTIPHCQRLLNDYFGAKVKEKGEEGVEVGD